MLNLAKVNVHVGAHAYQFSYVLFVLNRDLARNGINIRHVSVIGGRYLLPRNSFLHAGLYYASDFLAIFHLDGCHDFLAQTIISVELEVFVLPDLGFTAQLFPLHWVLVLPDSCHQDSILAYYMRYGEFFQYFLVGFYTPTLLQIRLAARPPTNIKMRLYAEPPAFPTCPLDIVLHGFFRRQILMHKVISHYELV